MNSIYSNKNCTWDCACQATVRRDPASLTFVCVSSVVAEAIEVEYRLNRVDLRHTTPLSMHAFAGGDAFTMTGVPIARDAALLQAGVDLNLTDTATLSLSYAGQRSGPHLSLCCYARRQPVRTRSSAKRQTQVLIFRNSAIAAV